MKVIAASEGLPTGVWVSGFETLMHWTGRSVEISDRTVQSVGYFTRKRALLVEGFLKDGYARAEVTFRIALASGEMLRAVGTPAEYESIVKASIRPPGDNVFSRLVHKMDQAEAAHAAADLPGGMSSKEFSQHLADEDDRDLLRVEFARWRATRQDHGPLPVE
jgi:hypothetical protein